MEKCISYVREANVKAYRNGWWLKLNAARVLDCYDLALSKAYSVRNGAASTILLSSSVVPRKRERDYPNPNRSNPVKRLIAGPKPSTSAPRLYPPSACLALPKSCRFRNHGTSPYLFTHFLFGFFGKLQDRPPAWQDGRSCDIYRLPAVKTTNGMHDVMGGYSVCMWRTILRTYPSLWHGVE